MCSYMDAMSNSHTVKQLTRRNVLRAIGSGTTLAALPVSNAAASPDGYEIETIFDFRLSHPVGRTRKDRTHEERFRDLLEGAVPGSAVHASLSHGIDGSREDLPEVFINAVDRGVDVNLVVDEHGEDTVGIQELLDTIPESVQIVYGGGVGDYLNHNKFLACEELENGEQDVVWQSSHNFTEAQLYMHDSTVVIKNSSELYDVYRSYWQNLADDEFQDMEYNRTEETNPATVYFSPRSDFDTHVKAVEDVVPSESTKIHIVMSQWTASRERTYTHYEPLVENFIRNELADLISQGATVRVILREDTASDFVVGHLEDAGAEVALFPSHVRDGPAGPHSKTMLIDADFETEDGDLERRREVWTGTQNLGARALVRNDEVLLHIDDKKVYSDFLRNWRHIRNQVHRANREDEE